MAAVPGPGVHAVAKAAGGDFLGRFREVVADPLNLLIARVPQAGTVRDGLVCLHNGLAVPYEGDAAYYGRFSDLLIVNRGVHEPLEEFVFQAVLPALPPAPCMLELGAYWGHYSMWLQQRRPAAQLHLVEPDPARLAVGRANLARNGFAGHFTQAFVGSGQFVVDDYLAAAGIERLDILHADIQGYELEMLDGAQRALAHGEVDRLFLSTHSQALHRQAVDTLRARGYRVEISADFDDETTSFDGFVYASHPRIAPLFGDWQPLPRQQILQAAPAALAAYVADAPRPAPPEPMHTT
jgi:hypothetical protein